MKTFVLRTLLVLVALIDGLFYGLEKAAYALGEKANRSLFKLMHRQGLILMANYYADVQNVVNGPAYGQPLATRVKTNKHGGRLRYFEAFFVVPAGTLAIADKIIWGKLPLKSRIVNHLSKLVFSAGTASSTLNLGDNIVAARHLAATSVASAGSAVPTASEQANTGTANTTNGSNVITVASSPGAFQVGALIAGTGIPANTTITGVSDTKIGASITLSSQATATGSGVTMTVTGGGYETTDDSNNVANGFASTTDDCTLTSTVAGAVLAAGQVITLKVAYVQD